MTQRLRLFALLLTATLMAGSALPSQALDREDRCRHQVERAEYNLRRAIERHGEHSRQAERRRYELQQARERCHFEHR
jgi:hypothetical protein